MSIENFGEALPALNRKTAERKISAARVVKPLRFEVRYDSAGVRFVNACCDKMQPKRRLFSGSRNECFDMIMYNHDELVANWEDAKLQSNITEDCIRTTSEVVTHTVSEDVSPEMIMQYFAPVGVSFGAWLNQEDRQVALNKFWVAMRDLGLITKKLPDAWLGKISISFGGRGSGRKAAAHWETGNKIINLTKTQGAGCLYHELMHSMDDGIWVLPKVPAFDKRCERADKSRSKKYWSTRSEKLARGFESYCLYKLAELGIRQDYGVNVVDYPDFSKDKEAYPYLLPDEMAPVVRFFDAIFKGELK